MKGEFGKTIREAKEQRREMAGKTVVISDKTSKEIVLFRYFPARVKFNVFAEVTKNCNEQ